MILIHIVNFGNAYPHLKTGILSFMMPTFLIITGYLVNIEKSPQANGNIPDVSRPTLRYYGIRFLGLSYFMPVRDGITELSLSQICEKIFVTSIGPYWFIQTMIICGILYYISFRGGYLGKPQTRKNDDEYHYKPLHLRHPTLAGIQDTALSPSAAAYYFIGTAIRQCHIEFGKIFHPSPAALLLWLSLLGLEEWVRLGIPGCNLLLLVLHLRH